MFSFSEKKAISKCCDMLQIHETCLDWERILGSDLLRTRETSPASDRILLANVIVPFEAQPVVWVPEGTYSATAMPTITLTGYQPTFHH
jgi:hypothetical protein